MSFQQPVIIVHGGAAFVGEDRIKGKINGIKAASKEGYKLLLNGASAIDAVEKAICVMEDNEYFNAGYGSVLNMDGKVEMEASIMDGSDLSAGAVAIVTDIKNPISLARLIKEKCPHVMLAGKGASSFAAKNDLRIVSSEELITQYARDVLEAFNRGGPTDENREMGGTVGCVALDINGNLAAGTSTGGMNGKLSGRVGDTCQIGSGTYADNQIGAVSCTGNGEAIMRCNLAFGIIKDMKSDITAQTATTSNIDNLSQRTNSTAGAITLSKYGEIGFAFSTKMMPWAYVRNYELHYGLEPGEHIIANDIRITEFLNKKKNQTMKK